MRWAIAGATLGLLGCLVSAGHLREKVIHLECEVGSLERALEGMDRPRVATGGTDGDEGAVFELSVPEPAGSGLLVPVPLREATLVDETLGRSSLVAARLQVEESESDQEGTPDGPEIYAIAWPAPPRLASWISCRNRIRALIEFADGSVEWLVEGEDHRGYRLVHADARLAVLYDLNRLGAHAYPTGARR